MIKKAEMESCSCKPWIIKDFWQTLEAKRKARNRFFIISYKEYMTPPAHWNYETINFF